MNLGILSALSVVAIAIGLPLAAQAERSTFNCAKAQGKVEKLICRDASLAALNRRDMHWS
jgi:uncharacterized protein